MAADAPPLENSYGTWACWRARDTSPLRIGGVFLLTLLALSSKETAFMAAPVVALWWLIEPRRRELKSEVPWGLAWCAAALVVSYVNVG